MSLQLVLGNSGSGKSEYLQDYMIQQADQHPQQNYLMIVPEQFTMRTQREFVLRQKGHCILNIDVLSFERLAYRVFDELGMNHLVVLDDTAKNFILRKAALEHMGELKILKKNVEKPGYVDEVKSLLSELTQYNVTPQDLMDIIEQEKESVFTYKLQDIYVLYQAFLDFLKNRFVTGEELLTVLAQVAKDSKIVAGSVIGFDGFTGFTPVQSVLLGTLFQAAKKSIVTVTMDLRENGTGCRGIQDLFYLSKRTVAGLYKIAQQKNIAIEEPISMETEQERRFSPGSGLEFLERTIYRNSNKVYEKNPQDIKIMQCKNPKEELQFAAAFIREKVRKEKYRYRDFAIVAGNLEDYENYAGQILEESHVPYFMDVKKKITFNRLVECIRSYLEIGIEGFSYASMFRFLKTGMTSVTGEEIDALENYVLAFHIRGYKMYKEPFVRKNAKLTEGMLEEMNKIRQKVFDYFADSYDQIMKITKARQKIEYLYDFLLKIQAEEKMKAMELNFQEAGDPIHAKEYAQIYAIVMELFDEYVELLGEDELSLEEFTEVLSAGFNSKKIGVIPPGNDQVVVGDIERTRLEHVKILIFIGVNDGIIPRITKGSVCLSQRERECLKQYQVELAPSLKERAFIQQFYLYLVMTKPSEQLIVTYGEMSNSGKLFCPSHLIGVLQKLFPQLRIEKAGDIPEGELLVSKEAGLRYLARVLQHPEDTGKNPLWIAVWNFMLEHNWKEAARSLVEGAFSTYLPQKLDESAAKRLYGEDLYNSVTRLENFSKCAFSHFLKYGLKLREREDGSFQPSDMGTIFHAALEIYAKQLEQQQKEWSEIARQEQERLVTEAMEQVLSELKDTSLMEDARSCYQINRMERILKRTVWAIGNQIKEDTFRPEEYEVPFQFIENQEGVSYRLETGENVNLVGRIDRIDVKKEEDGMAYRVVDYKTGTVSLNPTEVYYGLQLQLVVYLKAANNLLKEKYKDIAMKPAGMYYYHIDDPLVEAKRGEAELEIENRILKELEMKGFDEEEQLKTLMDYVDYKIMEIGNRMIQGEIQPKPYVLSTKTGCDYCEFHSICRFKKGKEGCKMQEFPDLKKEDSIQLMKNALAEQEAENGDSMDRSPETGN
ncbi:MAG: PD-(D/E)XK nuclease family protein [Lachnospiraceae bacterium]